MLLANDCDINAVDNLDNSTALHEAVRGKSIDLLEILLSHGAQQTIKNSAGRTPLHLACQLGKYKLSEQDLCCRLLCFISNTLPGDIAAVKTLCKGPFAKKAAQMLDKAGFKPNELCTCAYVRSVLEGIMKDSHIVVRPPKESIFS